MNVDPLALDCTKCQQTKPIMEFAPAKRKTNGRSSLCKSCHQAASVAWQKANPEKVKETRRIRYAANRDAGTLPGRKYNAAQSSERGRYKRYGVTAEMYAEMFARQDGKCAICNRTSTSFARPLAVDHDHACCPDTPTCGKCNRGLLCGSCNTALHAVENDRAWVDRAIKYLGEQK